MRRAVLAILGTAAATSLLVGLKAQAEPSRPPAAQPQGDPGNAEPAANGSPAASGAPAANAPGGTRTIEGTPAGTPYGSVVVTIVLTGDKITDIKAQLPDQGESAAKAADAGPKLRKQA